jgi:bifunctional DNA-binding transcriptional regulator/antitoxin component of YhaV-PrlF toxin-antitoxin module
MRLTKRVGRKIDDKTYYKYDVVIPTKDIEKLGWKGGEELKRTVKGKKLILEPE